ncbi:MAG: hypothetical protein KA981_07510 [Bacteroidia bacterium]|nr:hypothetical protein [Bacteroidia bacterium]
MKQITPIFFSLNLLLMLFGTSCKERPCPDYVVKVDTSYVPFMDKEPLESYHGFDTLKFLTEKGDTIIFLGQGLHTGYKQKDNYAEDDCSTKSTTFKQFIGYTFYPVNEYPSEIQYYVSRDLNSRGGVYFYIIINKHSFHTLPFFPNIGNPTYINNLSINGNIYNNVLKIYRNFNTKESSFIFYNKEEGIVKIIYSDGSSLSKIK